MVTVGCCRALRARAIPGSPGGDGGMANTPPHGWCALYTTCGQWRTGDKQIPRANRQARIIPPSHGTTAVGQLKLRQTGIQATFGHQPIVGALPNDPTGLHHHNLVRMTHRCQAVRHDQDRPVA